MKTKKIISFISFLSVLCFSALAFAQEGGDAAAVGGRERRLDGDGRRRQIARRFGGEQQADAHRHAAEHFRRRLRVAQRHQGIMHERVLDDVDRHGATISGRV